MGFKLTRLTTLLWPGGLRWMGFLLGTGELVNWGLTGHAPVSGVMTFAAGLIAAPNMIAVQKERNEHQSRRRGTNQIGERRRTATKGRGGHR